MIKKFPQCKAQQDYIFYNGKEDAKILAEYCKMLAKKINELNEEIKVLRKQLADMKNEKLENGEPK